MRPAFATWAAVEAAAAQVEAGGRDPFERRALGLAARAAARCGWAWGDEAWAGGHLAAARKGVLARLLFSLLREGLLPARSRAPEPSASALHALAWELPGGHRLQVWVAGRRSFGRPGRLLEALWEDTEGRAVALPHPLSLYVRVRAWLEGGRLEEARAVRFAEELSGSVAQLALGLGRASLRRGRLVEAGVTDLAAWEATHADGPTRRRALEGWVVPGHAVHPCTKTRYGFSTADALRSVPELTEAPVPLRLFALRREVAQQSGAETDGLLTAVWPGGVEEARAALGRGGLSPDDYLLLPVHPWQARHRVRQLFGDLLASRALVPLTPVLQAWPQASLRTLEPVGERPAPYHLKLALGVQTTSAERTISPQSVHNGPLLGALLSRLCAEPLPPALAHAGGTLGSTLTVARELGGAGLDPTRVPDGAARARHLALLVRESPDGLGPAPASRRRHWLAAALPGRAPFSLRSLAAELVLDAAARGGLSPVAATQAFFARYCRTLLLPTVWLLGRYGVALEAHGQNTWVDLDGAGLPVHLSARDFGGLRLFRPRLAAQGFPLTLYPGSAPDAESLEEVEAKVSHCALQSHLADLVEALEADLPGMLPDPWQTVRAVLEEVCAALGPADGARTLRALTAPRTRAKCLTRMRLVGTYNRYLYAEVDTPFATEGGGA